MEVWLCVPHGCAVDPGMESYCQGEGLASYSSNRLYSTPYPELENGDQ